MSHLGPIAGFPSKWGEVAAMWTVLAHDGTWLGEVRMPVGFTPMQIEPTYILGLHRDELGIETVREYELLR